MKIIHKLSRPCEPRERSVILLDTPETAVADAQHPMLARRVSRKLYAPLIERWVRANFPHLRGAALRVRWSQRAMCRCGCSPGFLVDVASSYTRSGWDRAMLDGQHHWLELADDTLPTAQEPAPYTIVDHVEKLRG